MSRPVDDPLVWSSDANYPAGVDTWNGTPTKVTPSAGVAAAGWEPQDLPPAQHLNYILNNHGQWLAYFRTAMGGVAASNWTGCTGTTAAAARCGTYASFLKMWFVGGSAKTASTSVDNGATWTSRTLPAGWSVGAICEKAIVDATKFIVVGNSGGNWIATSTDGVTWTDRSPAGTDGLFSVCWNGAGAYVAVGANGKIFSSANGTSWTARTAAGGFVGTFYDVTYAAGLFVAVGSGGTIQTSPDGVTWTARTAAASYAGNFRAVAYGGSGYFTAVGGSSGASNAVQTSPDGVTWTSQTAPAITNTPQTMAYSASMDVWCFTDFDGLFISRDPVGGTWARVWSGRDGVSMAGAYDVFLGAGGFAAARNSTNSPLAFSLWDYLA